MTASNAVPPGRPVQPRIPIGAGQAFIGLCNARGVALQLFYSRVIQIFLSNTAGIVSAISFLSVATHPTRNSLFLLAGGCLVAAVLQVAAGYVVAGSAARIELWTGKLVELENVNRIDGGVLIFSSPEYDLLKSKPAFPVQGLLWLLGLCMVVWVLIAISAIWLAR